MTAEFDSKCPICGEAITADVDAIARDMDGDWAHEDCVERQRDDS